MAFLSSVLGSVKSLKLIEMVYGDGNDLEEGETTIEADAVISESHVTASSVTNYPVESGARLSDHSARESYRITISGVISDASMSYSETFDSLLSSPVGQLINSFTGSNLKTKSQRAYDTLQKWMAEATPIIVKSHYAKDGIKNSSTGSNAPFVIESLTIPRDKSTGQALRFELALREVIIVTINKTDLIRGLSDKGAQSLLNNNKSATAAKNGAQTRTIAKLRDDAEAQNRVIGYTQGSF